MTATATPTYRIEITRRDSTTAGAFVHKSDGTTYTVAIGPDWSACSCKAGIYHGHCKHPGMVRSELAATYTPMVVSGGPNGYSAFVLRQSGSEMRNVGSFDGPDAAEAAAKLSDQLKAAQWPKMRAARSQAA